MRPSRPSGRPPAPPRVSPVSGQVRPPLAPSFGVPLHTDIHTSRLGGRSILIVLLLAAAIGVGYAVGSTGEYEFGVQLLLASTLTLCILLPVLSRLWTSRFDPFEPLLIIVCVYLVYCVAGPMLRLLTGDTMLIGRSIHPSLYSHALAAVIVAVLALWAGYHLPLGGGIARTIGATRGVTIASPAMLKRLRVFGWVLTFAAVAALVLWSKLEGASFARFFLPGILTDAETTGGTNIAYLFLAIEWFIPAFLILSISRGFPTPLVKWGYFLFVSIAYTSLGFRYRLIIFWVSSFMLAYLQRGRRPGASILLGGAGVILLFAGWLGIARTVFQTGSQQHRATPSFTEVMRNTLSDTKVFETFAAELDAVPERVDYAGVDPYIYVFVQPIPRALWPDKPYPTFLDKIAAGIGTPAAIPAGAAVPHFGEYYLAFGWVGLIGGMLIFGVLCRTLWEWFLDDRDDPWRQVIFAASNAFLVQAIIRGYTPQIVQEWCFIILPAVMGMYLVRRDSRRSVPFGRAPYPTRAGGRGGW